LAGDKWRRCHADKLCGDLRESELYCGDM